MKYVIVGGVAAGTKTAAKLLRCDRSAEVCIYTKAKTFPMRDADCPTMWAAASKIRRI